MNRRRILAMMAAIGSLLMSGWFVMAQPAMAQINAGLNQVGATTGLPSGDPRVIAARIINIALGFLAIILVTLMIYAGFLWMTAGGDAKKVEQAKLMIRNAIIGVIIVLSSWAIASYVISTLIGAVGGGGGGVSGGGPGGGGFGGGGGATSFQVRSISPAGSVPLRNVQVEFLFSQSVDPASATSAIQVLRASDRTPVDGTLTISGSLVTFVPNAACPAPNADRHCFDANTDFIPSVANTLRSTGGITIRCGGGFAPSCQGAFHTGTIVDTQAPAAAIVSPTDAQGVPADDIVRIITHATDDSGIARVDSFVDGASIGSDAPIATTSPLTYDATVPWDTTGVPTGTHVLQSRAFDIDTNQTTSSPITVVVRPRHCFNGVQDTPLGETGLDCGGECGACAGGSCSVGSDCASGVCTAGVCVEKPIITYFSPNNGRPGTLVSISGVNFGTSTGRVLLGGQPASAPAACVAAGLNTWSPYQVIVAVPPGAVNGPIQLTNTAGLSDATNDDSGPRLDDFAVNTSSHPGLCAAQPDHGAAGDAVNLVGVGLGTVSDHVYFNDNSISSFTSWSDSGIGLNAPIVAPATYAVKATTGGVDSNTVTYSLETRTLSGVPTINTIDPTSGPIGQYVTLGGVNFGSSGGTVKFKISGEIGTADVTFPAACGSDFWRDDSITVKVPPQIGLHATAPGTYEVYVQRRDLVESNHVSFSVNTAEPRPGICSLQPVLGPAETTQVTLIGERFGSTAGHLYFSGTGTSATVEASVATGDWTSGQVRAYVPRGSVTGPVHIQAGTTSSNGVNFQVQNCHDNPSICAAGGETCCDSGACSAHGICAAIPATAEYAWLTSTGQIPINPEVVEQCSADVAPPSPSPWSGRPGGDRACVNADIMMRFTTELDPTTVIPDNILVAKCADATCASTTPVAGSLAYGTSTEGSGYIRFRPSPAGTSWDASSTYRVIVRTGIQSDSGVPMLERASCGSGNGYCFNFTTRDSTDPCRVGSVSIVPNPFTAEAIGQQVPYLAMGRSADDICIVLNGSTINWQWTVGAGPGPDSHAAITAPPLPPNENATATAEFETGPVGVPINVSGASAGTPAATGTAKLIIRFIPPRVVDYGPRCDAACVNAAIWAKFNVDMDPSRVTPDNVEVLKCANESCRTFVPLPAGCSVANAPLTLGPEPGTSSLVNNFLTAGLEDASGATCLEQGQFYKVILRGVPATGVPAGRGFLSSSHLGLTGLNDPDGFAWTFRIGTGAQAYCATDHVTVTPLSKYESWVGARQLFSAQPFSAPDTCSTSGEMLIGTLPYAWTSSDHNVADFSPNGAGVRAAVDLTNISASHCSGSCVNTGADGMLGHVASCGDGVVETTDISYCHRVGSASPCTPADAPGTVCVTRFGDSCRMLPPGSSGGEECDWAAPGRGSSCNNDTCLWNPEAKVTDPVPGTCGNGTVEAGEQCDPGMHCVGGATDGLDCTASASLCSTSSTCVVTTSHGCSDSCQAMGSQAGGSVCKNGSVGDGETCDYGPGQVAGGGCSDQCVHEGSSSHVTSLCGDGLAEPGKSCEMDDPASPSPRYSHVIFNGTSYVKEPATTAAFSDFCDAHTCLNKGVAPCTSPGQINCCGNGNANEPGKDCDDGNAISGDGCSSRCLAEGSSIAYAQPSFCRDASLGTGEQCEVAAGTPRMTSSRQLFEITGLTDPGESGQLTATLGATYDAKLGNATYGLQCGFTSEASCLARAGVAYGLTTGGCCAQRPQLVANYPVDGSTNVCRNVQISATFAQPMSVASLTNNFLVAEKYATTTGACPPNTTLISDVHAVAVGWKGWLSNAWHRFMAFVTGSPAEAQLYVFCVGTVTGQVSMVPEGSGSKAIFTMDHALKAMTDYQVVLKGNADLMSTSTLRVGIRTVRGVQSDHDMAWSFTTGNRICTANDLFINDFYTPHPFLYQANGEQHGMISTVYSLQDRVLVPIVPVDEYRWGWQSWTSSNEDVLTIPEQMPVTQSFSLATGTAQNLNGSSLVTASIQVTNDSVNVPTTSGTVFETTHLAQVMLCERPWQTTPFQDDVYNFATNYCLDAGVTGAADDLPVLGAHLVPPGPTDASRGVLRQYLFTFSDATHTNDGIGIRVIANPLHLSAASWFASNATTGGVTPTPLTVDGYDAVRDGTSVYVAAANVDSSTDGPVTSTIYLISYNLGATPETINIFNQMLKNWTFNTNFLRDSSNVCLDGAGAQYHTSDGKLARCTADWECVRYDTSLSCASFKAKLQRDTRRIADFQSMTRALDASRTSVGSYPNISSGSFVNTLTTSRWPSWQSALSGPIGGSVPQDPINRFMTCGVCHNSRTVCMTSADCSQANDTCDPQNNYDPATCWNAVSSTYQCPSLDRTLPKTVSHIYQYRSVDNGVRYELGTELEITNSAGRYQPPLVSEVKSCANSGQFCQTDADCTVRSASGVVTATSTCNGTGGRWLYNNTCSNVTFGLSSVCGDGVVGPGELCEAGYTRPIGCTTVVGGLTVQGTKIQSCSDCRAYVDTPSSVCVPDSMCGNGRIDNMRCYGGPGYKYGQSCSTNADCVDSRDSASVAAAMTCDSVALHGGTPEACDDGALNGTYGHCNRTCTGYASLCGDGEISPGETCDNGTGAAATDPLYANGNYCDTSLGCSVSRSCNVSCHGPAPYCGDGHVDAPNEQCDGGSQQQSGTLCLGGTNAEATCTTAADCPGGTCGGDANHNSCTGVTVGQCAGGLNNGHNCSTDADCPASTPGSPAGRCIQYTTAHTRACNGPGAPLQCRWASWGACLPQHFCGDGTVDPGEECDNGSGNSDSGACTTQCKRNVCGDGLVNRGVEECDFGPRNGAGCTADYGSTCTACSNTCHLVAASGGFCGDGIINGPEQCDGTTMPSGISCRSLGFDYSTGVRCAHYAIQENDFADGTKSYCYPAATCLCLALSPGTCRFIPDSGTTPEVIDQRVSAACKPSSPPQEAISCNATCGFAGCARCQDQPGTGLISATVFDAVYSTTPVPNARVTLYNHGIRIEEAFTDRNGTFSFNNVNQRPECSSYTILVDKYDDNPLTTEVDESVNGGYWPYQSGVFNVSTFAASGTSDGAGHIFLLPQVSAGEALAVVLWSGSSDHFLDAHTYVPLIQQYGFASSTVGTPGPITYYNDCSRANHCTNNPTQVCGHSSDPACPTGDSCISCTRDVSWQVPGTANMSLTPHVHLYCFHSDDPTNLSCGSFTTAPETVRITRGPWAYTGQYTFLLDDYNINTQTAENYGAGSCESAACQGTLLHELQSRSVYAFVVTHDQVFHVNPPTTAPTCASNSVVKYWNIFNMDAFTGAVTIPGGTGQLMCGRTLIPGESTNQLPLCPFWTSVTDPAFDCDPATLLGY